jgi:hypothetical protein
MRRATPHESEGTPVLTFTFLARCRHILPLSLEAR